jgi:hypothetical protein
LTLFDDVLLAMPAAHAFGLDWRWWLWVAHLVEHGTNGTVFFFTVEEHSAGPGFGDGGDERTAFTTAVSTWTAPFSGDGVVFGSVVAVGSFGKSLPEL